MTRRYDQDRLIWNNPKDEKISAKSFYSSVELEAGGALLIEVFGIHWSLQKWVFFSLQSGLVVYLDVESVKEGLVLGQLMLSLQNEENQLLRFLFILLK